MSTLPQNWAFATLTELVGPGGTFSDGDWIESKDQDPIGGIRLLQLADIGDGRFLDRSSRYINESTFVKLRCLELAEGDILVARMPDPLGRACLMPALSRRCITVVDVAVIRPASGAICAKWLMHFLNSPNIRAEIELHSSGTTRKRISRGNLGNLQLPIPPLNEQKRIADKLDTLLAAVDACRARLDKVPALIKRFRQSVLAAATSGALTEDWRECLKLEDKKEIFGTTDAGIDTWRTVRLADVIFEMRNGLSPKPSETPPGSKILRIGSVRPGRIDFDDHRYLLVSEKDAIQYQISRGDLLFTRYNGTQEFVGVCGLVRDDVNDYVYPDKLIRVRVNRDLIYPEYLEMVFGAPAIRLQIDEFIKSSAGQKGISGADLKATEFSLPTLQEQREIVQRVETLLTVADKLDRRLAETQKRIGQLTPSILAQAFRGELVEQDPSDEPAIVLLEKIASPSASKRTAKKAA